jgi:benzoyl-CoA reductase/2-hydroxyglutaryl-CoA dehydratase subunit BcrC/BadD/HgdB
MTLNGSKEKVGFTCSYTPLPLIDAAGFTPFRILPLGGWPDQAGQLMHDNLCPHVKRILDRAMCGDMPEPAGMVFMNSCDAMRRLAHAWPFVRQSDRVARIDLPAASTEASVSYFSSELSHLAEILGEWRGRPLSPEEIEQGILRYNELSDLLKSVKERFLREGSGGGAAEMQKIYNRAVTEPVETLLKDLHLLVGREPAVEKPPQGVPIYLFGNVLPDPDVFALIEGCGASITDEDFCTGARMVTLLPEEGPGDVFSRIARGLLQRTPCARTFDPASPLKIAESILENAKASGAKGAIGYTVKFCDPYLARFPSIRDTLKKAGIPLLLLEGDLTLRSIGQHRTRIEAFIEMLG